MMERQALSTTMEIHVINKCPYQDTKDLGAFVSLYILCNFTNQKKVNLPTQSFLLSANRNPSLHMHLYEPIVLMHVSAHSGDVACRHSS